MNKLKKVLLSSWTLSQESIILKLEIPRLLYWFATGTPGWIVPYMKSRPCFLSDKIEVPETDLDTFDPVSLEMLPLLLQTGYLTALLNFRSI